MYIYGWTAASTYTPFCKRQPWPWLLQQKCMLQLLRALKKMLFTALINLSWPAIILLSKLQMFSEWTS